METKRCSFCKVKMPAGSGKMLVKKDGAVMYFCSSKCEKNALKLKRSPRKVKWVTSRKEKQEVL
jgi:large subunit ribosomal protein L24e